MVQDDRCFPADDRFNTGLIKLPQQKMLFDLARGRLAVHRELHSDRARREGELRAVQLLLGGNTDAKEAAQATEKIAQRIRVTQRKLMANFQKWAASYR